MVDTMWDTMSDFAMSKVITENYDSIKLKLFNQMTLRP